MTKVRLGFGLGLWRTFAMVALRYGANGGPESQENLNCMVLRFISRKIARVSK